MLQVVTVDCTSFSFKASIITSCGCVDCQGTNQVTRVTGRVFGYADDGSIEHLKFGEIYFRDEVIGYTSYIGKFDFEVPFEAPPLLVTFKDPYFNQFFQSMKTLQFQRGTTAQQDVVIMLKPDPIEVQAGQPFQGQLGSSVLSFTGGLIYNTGEIFDGTANFYIRKIDPSSRNDLEAAPDSLLALDNDGREVALETFGMTIYTLEDKDGNPLYATGNLTWEESGLDPANTSLWIVDSTTGKWLEVTPFETYTVGNKRRKKEVFSLATGPTPDLGSLPTYYCNVDRPLWYLCYLRVIVYADQTLQSGLRGAVVTVITQNLNTNVYSGFHRLTTGADGSVCVYTYCHYRAIIYVEGQGERLSAAQDQNLPTGQFKYLQ